MNKSSGAIKQVLDQMVLHRWAMPLAGILAAFGAALLVTQILAWRLDGSNLPALPEISSASAFQTHAPSPVQLSPNGFIPRAAPAPTAPAPTTSDAAGKTTLPIDLLGTFVGRHSVKSVALVQITTGSRDVKAMRVGEKWQGFELLEVERGRIFVRNLSTGAREYVSNDQLVQGGSMTVAGSRPAASAADVSSSSNRTVLSRAQVNRLIDNNTNVIFSWVDVQPYAVAGQVTGFKLNNIKPRGKPFFNLMGFSEGDIIKRVNGVKMDSVDKAVGLWGSVHGKDQVTFSIERQGIEKELTIEFKP